MDTRICKIHGSTKFNQCVDPRSEGGYRWRCGKCQTAAVSARRRTLKEMAVVYKGGECQNCGYNRSIAAMDFHHRDPTEKDFSIGGKGITRSFEALQVELDKCDLLCANCHREEHARLDKDYVGDLEEPMVSLFDLINT